MDKSDLTKKPRHDKIGKDQFCVRCGDKAYMIVDVGGEDIPMCREHAEQHYKKIYIFGHE